MIKSSKFKVENLKLDLERTNYPERINRIRGQLNGIAKMIEQDRACLDIVQQIAAIREALSQLGIELLKTEAFTCVEEDNKVQLNKLIEKLFKLD